MPFAIDSDLAPIDAEHVTIEGYGIAVDWVTAESSSGWLIGELVVEGDE